MKIGLMSDLHGKLPEFNEKVDVVCICGDIFPLNIQRDTIKSVVWFSREFVPWACDLDCEKVIFIAGNHDFALQNIVKNYFKNSSLSNDMEYIELVSSDLIKDKLMLPKKIVYLQDTSYCFNHVKFYGTPWTPNLPTWAFYKDHDGLKSAFKNIPDDCDVLLSHSPGTESDVGTSMWIPGMPMFGCEELNDRVKETSIKFWAAGHVHTGNHHVNVLSNGVTRIANVSLIDEDYRMNFEPLIIEL